VKTKKRIFSPLMLIRLILIVILILTFILVVMIFSAVTKSLRSQPADTQNQISYISSDGADLTGYPENLIKLYEQNEDAADFVLGYFENKDKEFDIDLSEYADCTEVPLLMQWDKRWGYCEYAGNLFGLSGCGPTCLSMAAIYVTGDTDLTPKHVGEFSEENGYASQGDGTSWTLISEGGPRLGLEVIEIPLSEDRIVSNLEVGNPIICVVGPGDFTSEGHYIVLAGYKDGKITVNDPNSYVNSSKTWSYSEIESQIRNLWVIR